MADTGAVPKLSVIHLGVTVIPYRSMDLPKKGRGKRVPGAALSITTGDVAEILESKYALFETFARVHQIDILEAMESSMQGSLESLMMGRVVSTWGAAEQKIAASFRTFISSQEAERVGIPGTPTKAALKGVNHRLRHPYSSKNKRRPSFRDTGLLMNSFRAWVE
jgi:hypothetical protein